MYRDLVKQNTVDVLLEKALVFINYQMRTISEVKKRLQKETKEESLINAVITELKRLNYLSDKTYVEEYVKEKLAYDIVGPMYIKEKLISKGIHFDLIDAYLVQYTTEKEYEKVYEFIQKEIRYPIKKARYQYLQSLTRKLVTKGFHLSVIEASITSYKEDIFAMIDDQGLLEKEIKELKKKYDFSMYQEKQKAIQKLLQKGFDLSTIKQVMN